MSKKHINQVLVFLFAASILAGIGVTVYKLGWETLFGCMVALKFLGDIIEGPRRRFS